MNREFENDQISPQSPFYTSTPNQMKEQKKKEILNKKATEKKNIFELDLPDWCLLQPR